MKNTIIGAGFAKCISFGMTVFVKVIRARSIPKKMRISSAKRRKEPYYQSSYKEAVNADSYKNMSPWEFVTRPDVCRAVNTTECRPENDLPEFVSELNGWKYENEGDPVTDTVFSEADMQKETVSDNCDCTIYVLENGEECSTDGEDIIVVGDVDSFSADT